MNNWIHIAVWAAVIGGVFGFLWWQGQVQRLALYIAETREELGKCSWPTWDELKGSTALIAVMVALLGLFIYVVDVLCNKTFSHPMVQALLLAAGVTAFTVYKKVSPRQ